MAKYRLVDPSTGRIGGWISRGRGFSEEIRPADILAIDLLERVDAFPSNVFPRFFPNPFENVDHGSRRAHDDRSIHFSRGEKFLLLRSKERGKKKNTTFLEKDCSLEFPRGSSYVDHPPPPSISINKITDHALLDWPLV